MKANEFVKKFGWDAAIAKVALIGLHISLGDKERKEEANLKRLIESYELVQSYGGLEDAKKALSKKSMLRWVDPETELLRKAIADVESCL